MSGSGEVHRRLRARRQPRRRALSTRATCTYLSPLHPQHHVGRDLGNVDTV